MISKKEIDNLAEKYENKDFVGWKDNTCDRKPGFYRGELGAAASEGDERRDNCQSRQYERLL